MELRETRQLTAGVKALLVLVFAVMSGFMWRVRGDHGWGSMWGMFAVGVMLTLVIFAFFGNRKKMSYEAIPVAIILLGITNGGWGTLNSQMGGYLGSTVPFSGDETITTVSISPFSGLWIMLLLGFGWMPLYAMYLGSLFSKKEYKFKHYIALIATFYVSVLVFQFFAAHYIMPFINREAVDMFSKGLADKGIELSPMMSYIKNFGSEAWAKKIPFGRNYFASIRAISYAAAALINSVAILIAMRDKVTAFISFGINLVCALSITLADVFLIIDSDAGFLAKVTPPTFLQNGSWSLWEYFTGFFLGFGIMLILVCLPKSIAAGEGEFEYTEPFKKKWIHGAYSSVLTLLFTFVVTTARPLGMRIADMFIEKGKLPDSDIPSLIITFAVCAIALIFTSRIAKKNIITRDLSVPVAMRSEDFCMKAAPVYFAVTGVIYFFTDDSYRINHLVAQIKSPSSFAGMMKDQGIIVSLLMIASLILFYILYSAMCKKSVKKK